MKNETGSGTEPGSPEKQINRREAIRRMAALLGGVGAAALLGQGCNLPRNRQRTNFANPGNRYLDHMYTSQAQNSMYGSYESWKYCNFNSYYGRYNSSQAYQSRW